MGRRMNTPISSTWPMNDNITVHTRLVFPTPSTNVCSNITPLFFSPSASPRTLARLAHYFTALTELLRAGSLAGLGLDGAIAAPDFFRSSNQLCQNRTIGLATNTDEYVPMIMPTTSANENPCSTAPPNRNSAMTVRNVRPDVMMVRLRV